MPLSSQELRILLVSEILKHPNRYVTLSSSNMSTLKVLQMPGQLPGDEFFMAFVYLFDLQLWIHHGMSWPVIYCRERESIKGSGADRVHLQCVSGIHYNPVSEDVSFGSGEGLLPASSGIPPDIVEVESDDEVCLDIEPRLFAAQARCHCGRFGFSQTIVTIQERSCCALMDTGAQVSLIKLEVLQELQLEDHIDTSDASYIKGLGGARTRIRGIIRLPFAIGGQYIPDPMPFAVVEAPLPYCLVLGANIIERLDMHLDFSRGSFRYALTPADRFSCSFFVEPDTFASQSGDTPCLVQDDLEVADNTDSINVDSLPALGLLLPPEQIQQAQWSNYTIKMLHKKIKDNIPLTDWKPRCLKPFKRYASRLFIQEGCLWFRDSPTPVMVAPFNLLVETMVQLHCEMCHIGRNKLIKLTHQVAWHPSVSSVAADICSCCRSCQMQKLPTNMPQPPIHRVEAGSPFSLIAADLLQLPRTPGGFVGCLVVTDHFSKWLSVVPVRNKQATTIASLFEHRILPTLPCKPERLLTDNSVEFSADVFNDVLNKYSIHHIYATPYHPESNGLVERSNRTVTQLLRSLCKSPASWADNLAHAVMTYNHTWHSAIDMSPSQCLMTRGYTDTTSVWVPSNITQQWKKGHPGYAPFQMGDRVWKRRQLLGHLTANKLVPKFEGPYVVTHVHENGVTYEIQRGDEVRRAHHTQLRAFVAVPDYLKRFTILEADSTASQLEEGWQPGGEVGWFPATGCPNVQTVIQTRFGAVKMTVTVWPVPSVSKSRSQSWPHLSRGQERWE